MSQDATAPKANRRTRDLLLMAYTAPLLLASVSGSAIILLEAVVHLVWINFPTAPPFFLHHVVSLLIKLNPLLAALATGGAAMSRRGSVRWRLVHGVLHGLLGAAAYVLSFAAFTFFLMGPN